MAGLLFLNKPLSAEKIKICFIFEHLERQHKVRGRE